MELNQHRGVDFIFIFAADELQPYASAFGMDGLQSCAQSSIAEDETIPGASYYRVFSVIWDCEDTENVDFTVDLRKGKSLPTCEFGCKEFSKMEQGPEKTALRQAMERNQENQVFVAFYDQEGACLQVQGYAKYYKKSHSANCSSGYPRFYAALRRAAGRQLDPKYRPFAYTARTIWYDVGVRGVAFYDENDYRLRSLEFDPEGTTISEELREKAEKYVDLSKITALKDLYTREMAEAYKAWCSM